MSTSTIDFSKYEQPATQIDFSKYESSESNPIQQSGLDPFDEFGTLKREASSLGHAITGVPGSIYHSFADDPQSPEEKQTMAEHPIVGRAAMGLGRIMVDPIRNAAQWYGQAAKGQIPNPYEQALSVAPEAIGSAAGNALAMTAGPEIASRAIDSAKALPGKIASIPNISGKVAGMPVRLGMRALEATANQKLVPLRPLVNINTPADAAEATHFKIPGRDLGLKIEPKTPPGAEVTNRVAKPTISDDALREGTALPQREVYQAGNLGLIRPTGAPPASQTGEALGSIPTSGQLAMSRLQPLSDEQVLRAVSLPGLEDIKPLSPRVESSPATTVRAAQLKPERPVTENPVVGSLVRAMQESGVPIAKRPNLLLKGSGRVDRILGPEEDLSDVLKKSLRQVGRQKDQ